MKFNTETRAHRVLTKNIHAMSKTTNSRRLVKVFYANGINITTSMAEGVTDEQIHDYFAIGKKFNIGEGGNDDLQAVTKVMILE